MTPQPTSGQLKEWTEGITQVLTCQPANKPRLSITARTRGVQERTVGYRVQEGVLCSTHRQNLQDHTQGRWPCDREAGPRGQRVGDVQNTPERQGRGIFDCNIPAHPGYTVDSAQAGVWRQGGFYRKPRVCGVTSSRWMEKVKATPSSVWVRSTNWPDLRAR